MSDEVKISAIVSTYASEEFMAECLDDLIGQTAADQLEIIVVDACSPQGEGEIVARYQKRFPRINYIRTPERIGIYAAWNVAIRAARGKYLTPFSTNDRLAPDAYEVLSRYLNEHPDVDLVYGDTHLTDLPHQTFENFSPSTGDEGPSWQWPPFSYFDLLVRCSVGPHPMWRSSVHGAVGYFDESFKCVGDQDFWLRVGRKHVIRNITRFTGLYWREEEALSNQEGAYKELARLRLTYVPAYLKGRNFGECNPIRDKVLEHFEKGELAQAIIAYKNELEQGLLTMSCKLSEEIMLLVQRGRFTQAHARYHACRTALPDFPELAELDALMEQFADQLDKHQR